MPDRRGESASVSLRGQLHLIHRQGSPHAVGDPRRAKRGARDGNNLLAEGKVGRERLAIELPEPATGRKIIERLGERQQDRRRDLAARIEDNQDGFGLRPHDVDVDHRVAEGLLAVPADVDRNHPGLEPGPGEALDLLGFGLAEEQRLFLDRRRVRKGELECLIHGVKDPGAYVAGEGGGESGEEEGSDYPRHCTHEGKTEFAVAAPRALGGRGSSSVPGRDSARIVGPPGALTRPASPQDPPAPALVGPAFVDEFEFLQHTARGQGREAVAVERSGSGQSLFRPEFLSVDEDGPFSVGWWR
jgi:hypothetical protein